MSGKGQHHKLSENAHTVPFTVKHLNSNQSQLYPKNPCGSRNNAMYLLITDNTKVSVFKAAFFVNVIICSDTAAVAASLSLKN
jgi:hypothetical protein